MITLLAESLRSFLAKYLSRKIEGDSVRRVVGDLRIFSLVGFFEFVNSFEPLHKGHL